MAKNKSFLSNIISRDSKTRKTAIPVTNKSRYKIIYNKKERDKQIVEEEFKSQLNEVETPFTQASKKCKDLREHPFDYDQVLALYKSFGPIKAVVDKYTDFILGPGFHVTSKDERVSALLNKHMKDTQFHSVLDNVITTALITGTVGLEIGKNKEGDVKEYKIIEPTTFFIRQDNKGKVVGYCQVIGTKQEDPIKFDVAEVAVFDINRVGTSPYGQGIVNCTLPIVDNILSTRKDMFTLIKRKANSPLWAKLGGKGADGDPIEPTEDDVNTFGQELEYMNNKTEFATGPFVELSVIDYGKISEKFEPVLADNWRMFFTTVQVPEVLLGDGNVSEGLADVQLDAFERRVSSLQEELEKVIEEQIFKQILEVNGFADADAEFVWGLPSTSEKNARLTRLVEILKITDLDLRLRIEIEKVVGELIGVSFEEAPEEERAREQEERQPIVPTQVRQEQLCGCHVHEGGAFDQFDDAKDFTISEFVNFNYLDYTEEILDSIKKDGFDLVRAKNLIEASAGKLSTVQIDSLRVVLNDGITNNWSMNEIAKQIEREVKPADLLKMNKEGDLDLDADGNPKTQLSKKFRPIMIARTEVVRLSNNGALKVYEKRDVEKVRWVSALSERTCDICGPMNGMVYEIKDASGVLPIHPQCRCRFVPIIEGLSKK